MLTNVPASPIVDCSVAPTDLPPCARRVLDHVVGGLVDCRKLQIYLTPEQEVGLVASCAVAVAAAKDELPANIVMLMHLFHHQEFIPEEWKRYTTIGFPGTEVEDCQGEKSILVLGFVGKWYIGVRKLSYSSSAKKPLVCVRPTEPE